MSRGSAFIFCDSCKRSTWVAWRFAPVSQAQAPVQQLQQQQPQPKKDGDKE
jgi:hypothetical protein